MGLLSNPTFTSGVEDYIPYFNTAQALFLDESGTNFPGSTSSLLVATAASPGNNYVAIDLQPLQNSGSSAPNLLLITAGLTFSRKGTSWSVTYPIGAAGDGNVNNGTVADGNSGQGCGLFWGGSVFANSVVDTPPTPSVYPLVNFTYQPVIGVGIIPYVSVWKQTFVQPFPVGFNFDTVTFNATVNSYIQTGLTYAWMTSIACFSL